MYQVLLVMLLLVATSLIALIMLRQGNGVQMGSSFGVGSPNTLFSSSYSGSFITRMTTVLATLFFVLSLIMGNISNKYGEQYKQWDDLNQFKPVDKVLLDLPTKPANNIP